MNRSTVILLRAHLGDSSFGSPPQRRMKLLRYVSLVSYDVRFNFTPQITYDLIDFRDLRRIDASEPSSWGLAALWPS